MATQEAGPELAVILVAYRRREYLAGALESIRLQTLPRSKFEVLVVTDAADPLLERSLAERGIAYRVDPEPVIGRWLLNAIDATRAPWVTILEDDDVWEPERLARAREVMRAHPDLCYYRNRVTVVDPTGRRVPASRIRSNERERALDRTRAVFIPAPGKEASIAWMRRNDLEWLNLSTMAFRRNIFDSASRPVIAECECPDLFTFVAANLAGGSLYLDDIRATRYRRHPGSASRSLAWRRRHLADHQRLLGLVERQRGPEALREWLAERTQMLRRVIEAGEVLLPIRSRSPREESQVATRRYLRALLAEPALAPPAALRWSAGALAATSQIAPALTHRLLRECDRRFDIP